MKIERTKNATRNILFGTILKVYQIILPFLMRTAMIYLLGIEYLGLNSLFTSILQVLNLAELGVGSAMVYSMYKPIIDDDKTTICALLYLYKIYYRFIGVVIGVLGAILLPVIPNFIHGNVPEDINIYILYLLNLVTTVLSYWLFAYKGSILQAYQRIDVTSKVLLLTETIKYVVQFAVLAIFHNYYYYVIVILSTQVLTNILTAVYADKMYPDCKAIGQLPKETIYLINRRIRDLFTAKFGSVVVGSVDAIVISTYLGLTILAMYQNYYFIMSSIIGLIAIIFSAVIAGMGNSLVIETMEKNYNDLKKFTFIICWILCMCCCCFIGLYQPFMQLWVGSELMLPYGCVVLFCVYFYVCELSMVWATVKDAAGLWHSDRYRPLIGASVNLILNLVMVNYIGIYGILLSTIISYVFISMPWLVHNLFSLLYKRSLVNYMKSVGQYVIVAVVSCIVTYLLCKQVIRKDILGLVFNALICVTVPNLIQFFLFRKRNEFSQTIILVKKMFDFN